MRRDCVPVLVVCEDAAVGANLMSMLRRGPVVPQLVADVPSALACAHQAASEGRHFRLVFSEAAIDGIDGFTLAEWLNRERRLTGPVVLLLSAAESGDAAERCRAVGAIGLEKPVSEAALWELVSHSLEIQQPELAAAPSAPCVYDRDDAVRRCFGKEEMFRGMAGFLFEEEGPLLAQMRAALTAGQAEELAKAAHRLKGTVGYLAAATAMDAVSRVERLGHAGELADAAAAIEQLEREIQRLKQALEPYRGDGQQT
jgi:HPt (histidine-containing phosphotransfer) domain-containing protein